ncbi:MAG: carboxyl transferase domain-containing protein [Pseudomonadota bacterium]
MKPLTRVLIANRGEIAIRIAHAARSLNMTSVAVYSSADERSLHTRHADDAVPIGAPGEALQPYLSPAALVAAARDSGCDALHPGYGFLSENTELAERCASAGITFVGPSATALALFGNKISARALATELDIPVIPGSEARLTDPAAALRLADDIGYPVMLKAAAGGGGRGMRAVADTASMTAAFERCSGEAASAFGDGTLFMERLIREPRHIEVQILADAQGAVVHLHERDCSVQRRNQKVLEIAPAPDLTPALRERILAAAVRLVAAAEYANAGTVEFLVEGDTDNFYFIECNPRIQVEHTVTEQITGVDLVAAQLQIAGGATLQTLGLGDQADVPSPRGFAIQARVVAAGAGSILSYKEPGGPGVRVDACGYAGYAPPPQFDPLLAKVIGSGATYPAALTRTRTALADFHIDGLPTNLGELQQIVELPEVVAGQPRTSLLGEAPAAAEAVPSRAADLFGALPAAAPPAPSAASRVALDVDPGDRPIDCPLASTLIECRVIVGDEVAAGTTLFVVSAMKMETEIIAPIAGQVTSLAALVEGDALAAGEVIAAVRPSADGTSNAVAESGWQPLLDEVATLQDLAARRLAPESQEPGVVRQRTRGKLTCRERIELLLDTGSFREVGSLAGFASYDDDGAIDAFTPANHVGGYGRIEGRKNIVCADDFTSRGGHADGAIGAKSVHLDRLSIELRIPSVRLLDGSSGGGSVAAMVPQQKKDGESSAKESSGAIKSGRPRVSGGGGSFLPGHLGSNLYAEQLSHVPVVNVLLGSVVGIGAAKAVLGHFSVMVRNISQLFVAGPPVVSHAMGYDITKEELGDWRVHCTNGSVDNLAEDEEEAADMARRFLSYLPSSVYEAPPVSACSDPIDRREEELLHLIPRKRTTTFNVRRAIKLIADRDSFFEIGPLWGTDQITGFVRLNGHPMGVIASDSQHANGGALTADGCDKLKRHLDLCDLFHVPILNLIDNPGFAVGLEHERASTIRRGGEWMVAFAQVKTPIFSVLMRRSFGVAGNNYATPRSRPSTRVAWPAADVGGIPPEGGIEAAYKRQLAEAEDPAALRAELEARIESARGPIGPLNRFQIEEMIDPRDTRRHICEWLDNAYRIVGLSDQLGPRAIGFRP